MALDKLTLLDETIVSSTATTAATTVVNNSAQTNYISYPVAVGNPLSNGWRVYSDGASTSPVDGTGGSPNTTLTQNTSSPLNSTGDFRITKTTGASRQGEGISTDFTIASRHLAKVLQISFDYEVLAGSTLANDDLRVYIIANPSVTPVVIEPVNVSIQGVLTGTRVRHLATFQTDFTITTYRLCIHIATTTSSTQNIDFNNFRVWETTQTIGSIITDWVSYTPIFASNGTPISVTIDRFEWRRVGSSVEIRGRATPNAVMSTPQTISLPSGLFTNTNSSNTFVVGTIYRSIASENNFFNLIASNNSNLLTAGGVIASSTSSTNPLSAGSLLSSGETYVFNATVPIAGWGSSVAMSSDTGDSRVVACYYNTGANITVNTSTPIRYTNRIYDTHNAYETSTGKFTAPVSGFYNVKGSLRQDTGTDYFVLYKGTSIYQRLAIWISGDVYNLYNGVIQLNAGETLEIRTLGSAGNVLVSSTSAHYIAIERISAGSQVIASQETVGCEVWTDTTTTASSSANFIFNRVNRDTHGAWNITTGIYTAPMSGWYNFNLIINPNTSPTSGTIDLYKALVGGSLTKYKMLAYLISGSSYPSGIGSIYLLAGEQISFRYSSGSFTAYGTSTLASNSSWLTINRVGN